jgi:hypothetical protein
MSDSTEMSGLPSHVRLADEAAAQAEGEIMGQQQQPPASQSAVPASPSTVESTSTAQGQQQAPAESTAQAAGETPVTDAGAKELTAEELKAKVAELEAIAVDQRNRLRRHHGQQRVAREAMEQEVANLKAELAKRDARKPSGEPADDADEAVLLRNGFTQAELDEMNPLAIKVAARPLRKVEEAARTSTADRDEIRRSISSRAGSERLNAADAAIEAERPGFLAAIQKGSEEEADWAVFSSEVNPASSMGLTWKETLETARKVGDTATVLRVADLFARDARLSFTASGQAPRAATATRVDVPPRRVMPSAGPAAPTPAAAPTADATRDTSTYPNSYIEAFFQKAARLQGAEFRPFTIAAGGITKRFATIQESEREYALLQDAADEGRTRRG